MSVSIVVLTHNEERNLVRCLESVAAFDDVVVFDSHSTDRTVELARAAGARVVQHAFKDYATQRSAALTASGVKHPWVFMLDADETMTEPLAEEVRQAVANASLDQNLFRVRRKDMFHGIWIRRSSGYPTWFGRLMRHGRVRIDRAVNEEYSAEGPIGYLQQHLVHYPFRRGLAHWVGRQNQYSDLEAGLQIRERRLPIRWRDAFVDDPSVRRRFVKRLAWRIPGRPVWVFLHLYVLRLGVLEGRAGFRFCALRAFYEYLIDLKIEELGDSSGA